jgi:protein-L-isoaspartate(D-aspartate) O-methyltransferase
MSTTDEIQFTADRQRMVQEHLQKRDIYDPRVLEAMAKVPRHRFVPREYRHQSYSDCPLPIGWGQTISQPYIVALMTQSLMLRGEEIVLEIGTGSGYQAAVLAHLAREVHSVERHRPLAVRAARVLASLELLNVHVHFGDGSRGWPKHAPYGGILATAAAPRVPQPLLDQLADGGRLVLPVGSRGDQVLERWTRQGDQFRRERTAPVAFVPMLGLYGWQEEEWEAQ